MFSRDGKIDTAIIFDGDKGFSVISQQGRYFHQFFFSGRGSRISFFKIFEFFFLGNYGALRYLFKNTKFIKLKHRLRNSKLNNLKRMYFRTFPKSLVRGESFQKILKKTSKNSKHLNPQKFPKIPENPKNLPSLIIFLK